MALARRIVPSVLSADFADLAKDVALVQKAGAQSVQIDVMDGHFVPNITVGADVVGAIRKHNASIYLDVHLMIENPWMYFDAYQKAGANLLTVHVEACKGDWTPAKVIQEIKKRSIHAGLAVRPKTSADVLFPFLKDLDLALVMTVEPGFGGQAFMADMLPKVRALREKIDQQKLKTELQVDGGINTKTAPLAAEAGATSLVAGSAVYGTGNTTEAFQNLQKLVSF